MRHSHSQPPAGGVLVAGMASWAGCMRLPAAGGYVNFTDPGNCMGTSQGIWPPADQGPTQNASGAITTTPWNLGGLTGYGLTLGWLDVRGRKWGWGDKRACIQFVCTAAALAAVCASTQRKVADHTRKFPAAHSPRPAPKLLHEQATALPANAQVHLRDGTGRVIEASYTLGRGLVIAGECVS